MGRVSYGAVMDARNAVISAETSYLRQRGWKSTSDVPGSYVLWTKEIGGREVIVETRLAVEIERDSL